MSCYFWPILTPSPCHTLSHIPEPPQKKYVTHLGPPFLFLGGLLQKTRTKILCTNSLSIVHGVFSRGLYSLVWKVLFGVVFVRSPSVRIHLLQQKVKHHLKFQVSYVL